MAPPLPNEVNNPPEGLEQSHNILAAQSRYEQVNVKF